MRKRDREEEPSVALYWDFENLHASLCEAKQEGAYSKQDNRFRVQEPLIEVQAIVELAASFGPIAINRAYCNWQYFSRYRDALLQNAVELIQLFPPGGGAKNGADIKLCLDAMEDIGRFGHIGTVVIVSGDSDFMPLSQKIKAAGRTLVGVGARPFTNRHWAKSCHEFRYYESLLESPAPTATALQVDAAAELLQRALRLLAPSLGDGWVGQTATWQMIKRLDPSFEPREHGYADFPAMLKALATLLEVREGEPEPLVRLR
ncbi:OST-HTH/LOTUS domain-containing protein [Polaromonas sp. OV174]|uniref:NYN domain-containing protein n=1 Tax=Polaromonas sp. OV174 TaxID=1855300 RepID=UPI0008E5E580|nr:NYN domain-containing protein [Polaromonas sp. OV174]SFB94704.1 OST-HTH/LOTUS domain-containing protein [Polaromonas sp. OV174]